MVHHRVLKTLFDSCDDEAIGSIHVNRLPGLLVKIGKEESSNYPMIIFIALPQLGEVVKIIEACSAHADESNGMVTFDQFTDAVRSVESTAQISIEGPDPKVVEFMRILEEYRVKCEEEGNYLEAGRANKQLDILRTQEEKRQQKAIRVRQITERQDVQVILVASTHYLVTNIRRAFL
jgi:hypothetical protein